VESPAAANAETTRDPAGYGARFVNMVACVPSPAALIDLNFKFIRLRPGHLRSRFGRNGVYCDTAVRGTRRELEREALESAPCVFRFAFRGYFGIRGSGTLFEFFFELLR